MEDIPEYARAAVSSCSSLAAEAKQGCYTKVFLGRLRDHGVSDALSALRSVAAADRDVERDGHVYTHAIGIEAFRLQPDLSEVFVRCSPLFQSGCYHGVIQAYFMTRGSVTPDRVRELCTAYKGPEGDRWTLFQCLHGLGHGLTMFYGHDLPRALSACDFLAELWDRRSCYGGAFMENIMHAVSPHHPASLLAAGPEGDAGGAPGAEAEAAGAHSFKPLDPEDPLYPCSMMEERYLAECYMMQTSAMLSLNGGDFTDASHSCERAPESMRRTCFQSLGRDASSYALQDPRKSLRLCGKASREYRQWCYVGLVKNFIDVTASTESAFDLCPRIDDRTARLRCYEAIGEEIAVLDSSEPARRERCEESGEGSFRDACLYGARVLRERPEGL